MKNTIITILTCIAIISFVSTAQASLEFGVNYNIWEIESEAKINLGNTGIIQTTQWTDNRGYGLYAAYNLSDNVAIIADYDRIDYTVLHDSVDAEIYSAGVRFTLFDNLAIKPTTSISYAQFKGNNDSVNDAVKLSAGLTLDITKNITASASYVLVNAFSRDDHYENGEIDTLQDLNVSGYTFALAYKF